MAIRIVFRSHELNEMLLGLLLFHDARIYHVPAFLFVKWILKCCHETLKQQTNEVCLRRVLLTFSSFLLFDVTERS